MIRYSTKAIRDLIQAKVTDDYLRELRETCLLIGRFQGIGHPVPGNGTLRVYRHEEHKIYYRAEGADVFIVRLLHVARRVPKHIRGK